MSHARGLSGHAFLGPLEGRGHECFLDGVLSGAEIAITADNDTEHLGSEVPQEVLRAAGW